MAVASPVPNIPLTSVRRGRPFLVIGLGLFVVAGPTVAELPLKFLLKNHLHAGPTAMAGFFALAGVAWFLKPLAGMLSDSVPLWGTRRRGYLLASSVLAVALCVLLALVPKRYGPLLWTVAALNAMAVMISSVAGGLLVEAGQRGGMTGRLSALRQMIGGLAGVLAGPVGGYLATLAFGWTCAAGAMLFCVLIPVVAFGLPERRVGRIRGEVGANLRAQWGAMRQSRALWLAAAFLFLEQISPGFGTPLFYYQTNVLKFSPTFLGLLSLVTGVAGFVGIVLYGVLCGRVPLRGLLTGGIPLSALGSLLYLGYRSHGSALVIEGANTLLSIGVAVALTDLAARATPRGCEALGYSLLMGASNLAVSASDVLGSWLSEKHHVPLPDLIWINAVTSALPLLALPLLPRALLARPDGVVEERSVQAA